jgi:rsbT co-antagonist protein RsbR
LNAVSTPIVPVSEGIAVLPLMGSMDKDKATQLLESVPAKLQVFDLRFLINDFSGVYNLDSVTVEFLFNITSIMKLLGIFPVVTGIRPELARRAVTIGKDLSAIRTMRNVQQALQFLSK